MCDLGYILHLYMYIMYIMYIYVLYHSIFNQFMNPTSATINQQGSNLPQVLIIGSPPVKTASRVSTRHLAVRMEGWGYHQLFNGRSPGS